MIYVVYPITSPIWKAGFVFTYCQEDCGTFELMTDLSLNKERLLIAWAGSRGSQCLACKYLIQGGDKPITRCRITAADNRIYVNVSPKTSYLRCGIFSACISTSGYCKWFTKVAKPEERPAIGAVLSFTEKVTEEIMALIETERASGK